MVKFVTAEEISLEDAATPDFRTGDKVKAFGDNATFICYEGDKHARIGFYGSDYSSRHEVVSLERITRA